MADGRMLRRRITRSQAINAAVRSIDAQLGFGHGAYAGLLATWTIAFQDRAGRVPADTGWLRSEVFSLQPQVTPELVEQYMAQLARLGVFLYYSDELGNRFLQWSGVAKCNKFAPAERVVYPEPTPERLVVQPDPGAQVAMQCSLQIPPVSYATTNSLGNEGNRNEGKGIKECLAPSGARLAPPVHDVPSAPPANGSASSLNASPPPAAPGPTFPSHASPPPAAPGPTFPSHASPPPAASGPGSASSVRGSSPAVANGSASSVAGSSPAVANGSASSVDASPPPGSGPPFQVVAPTAPRHRKNPPDEPMPFTVAQAVHTLQACSAGRFDLEPFDGKHFGAPVTALIREFPGIDDWRLIAEAFAAGLDGWMTRPLTVRNLVKSGAFGEWIRQARHWRDGGRAPFQSQAKRTAATGLIESDENRRAMANYGQ